MSQVAVIGEGLSKRYRVGEYQAGYETLRDTIARGARRLTGRESAPQTHEFWALTDVSFEIPEGQVVGFIGRNGAGKSTLLKILTRTTAPTRGRAEIRGRVGSILEVGTGFHPELTGRENVFLNGAILGMKRREIQTKLDRIIEFSGVEAFVDTPVKRYSSGMYVRLAFAVAAHLDPEVLIIDEVLAVGDQEFQQRCMGRIEEFGGSGRTVVFVSHDMSAVSRLCDIVYWLDQGRVVEYGEAETTVGRYLQAATGTGSELTWDADAGPGDDLVRLTGLRVIDRAGLPVESVDVREPVGIEISFRVLRSGTPVFPKIKVFDFRGHVAFNALDTNPRWRTPAPPGDYTSIAWIPANLLNEGGYIIDAGVASVGLQKLQPRAGLAQGLSFHVRDAAEGDPRRVSSQGS